MTLTHLELQKQFLPNVTVGRLALLVWLGTQLIASTYPSTTEVLASAALDHVPQRLSWSWSVKIKAAQWPTLMPKKTIKHVWYFNNWMQYRKISTIILKRKSNNKSNYIVYIDKRDTYMYMVNAYPPLKSPLFWAMHRWQTTDAPDVMRRKIMSPSPVAREEMHADDCATQQKTGIIWWDAFIISSKKTDAEANESFSSDCRSLCNDFGHVGRDYRSPAQAHMSSPRCQSSCWAERVLRFINAAHSTCDLQAFGSREFVGHWLHETRLGPLPLAILFGEPVSHAPHLAIWACMPLPSLCESPQCLTSNTCRQTGCGEFKWIKTKKWNSDGHGGGVTARSPQIIQFFNVSMFSMYAICPISIHIYFTCTLTIHSVHLFNTTLVPMYSPMCYTYFTYTLTKFSPVFPVLYLLHRYYASFTGILTKCSPFWWTFFGGAPYI